jgi:hypothetical protein
MAAGDSVSIADQYTDYKNTWHIGVLKKGEKL